MANLPDGYEVVEEVEGVEPGKRTLIEHAPSYRPANKASIPVKHADYRAVASFRPKVPIRKIEEVAREDAKSRSGQFSPTERAAARWALVELFSEGGARS